MFGNAEGLRLGQIEHMPLLILRRRLGAQRLATARTRLGIMVDHRIGGLDLPQRLALMPFLPAGLLARWLTQTLDPPFSLQPVTRRWLTTVGAVQSQPPLELFHAL